MLVCFLIKDIKGVELDGRGYRGYRGGIEGGKMVIKTYYMRKNLFSLKEGKGDKVGKEIYHFVTYQLLKRLYSYRRVIFSIKMILSYYVVHFNI